MSGAIVGGMVTAMLPPATALLGELIAAASGEQEKAQIREALTELLGRLDAVPLPSAVAGTILGRALEERRAAAAEGTITHALPDSRAVPSASSSPGLKSDRATLDTTIDLATGMQAEYLVLSAEERARGFVRPLRESYVHLKCGTVTKMARGLAETYAREPAFYSGTFCANCRNHFPVGENGEFVWDGTDEKVGT